MGALVGLFFGVGALLIWRSGSRRPPRRLRNGAAVQAWVAEMLAQAGIDAVTPAQLVAASFGCGLVVVLAVGAVSESLPIAVAFGLFAALGPMSLVRYR